MVLVQWLLFGWICLVLVCWTLNDSFCLGFEIILGLLSYCVVTLGVDFAFCFGCSWRVVILPVILDGVLCLRRVCLWLPI